MSGIRDTATVTLNVNGAQAKEFMADLEKKIKDTEAAIEDMKRNMADPKDIEKAKKQLKTYKKQLEEMKSATEGVDRALENIDLATPRQLEKALKTLNRQMKDMVPGSEVWDSHVEKIRELKARLGDIKEDLGGQKSLWDRLNQFMGEIWPTIDLFSTGYDNVIGYLRKYVDAFADMEQEMANVRKFTGMTEDQVASLNEQFKKIDTRSSREELNKLAQEAGRLGKTSEEDVLGFVRAADKINVALDDLGEGATLVLSKLTGIFGDEARYGTEQSLLKVGSVINELSQNCSASAPYLSNFAERMGGVGAQAKMTIPQIMGFAAVLDSNAQKVEASATALSQIIVRLYQDPAKYAKVAGLDAQEFAKLMREDANSAIILFLETLQKAGGMDQLSPMFKDMGENGSRAIAALSTLATHIDQVRAQQEAANVAFREGTSIDNEFAVQNNTVQASLDKCKNKANELGVELGQRLYPLMSHFLTTGSALMQVLLMAIRYLSENRTAVISLATAWTVYLVALNASNVALKINNALLLVSEKTKVLLKGAVLLLSAAYSLATGNITRASAAMKLFNLTVKANPIGLLLSLVTAAVTAFTLFKSKVDDAKKSQKEINQTLHETNSQLRIEQQEIDREFSALMRAKKGSKEYENAKNKIIEQYGQYLTGLIDEKNRLIDVEAAYLRVSAAARDAAIARGMGEAKKVVDDQFIKDNSMRMADVEDKLKKYLKSQDELAPIMQLIRSDLDKYHYITTETADMIKSSINKGRKENSATVIFDAIRAVGEGYDKYDQDIKDVETKFGYTVNEFEGYSKEQLDAMYDDLNNQIADRNSETYELIANGMIVASYVYKTEAAAALSRLDAARGKASVEVPTATEPEPTTTTGYEHQESDKERQKREAEARRAAIKEKQEFKKALNDKKGEWEAGDAQNVSDYSAGLKSWSQYLLDKYNLELKYFEDREAVFKEYGLEEDEDYQELLKKKADLQAAWLKKNAAIKVEDAKRMQAVDEMEAQKAFYSPDSELYHNEEALQQALFEIRMKYIKQMQAAYNNSSEEWHEYQTQIEQAEGEEQLRRQKLLSDRVAEWKKRYEYVEAKKRLDIELSILEEAYAAELLSYDEYLRAKAELEKKYKGDYLPTEAKPKGKSKDDQEKEMAFKLAQVESMHEQGLLSEEEYNKAIEQINKSYMDKAIEEARRFGSTETNQLLDIYEAWKKFFDDTEEDGGNWAAKLAALARSVFAVMSSGMQQASEFMRVQAELDVVKVEKKYDREIQLAQGNTYKVAKLEKKKEAEIAKVKNDANKKMFAMQVVQAVAQTATNALNAYGSAAAIPVVGHVLAPIAAAMAVAAGAIQIATIKKQQQLAEAKGYSSGGFTKPGRVDEPAGIVHAGEWVASQKLLSNPVARPLIEALDYAQRNNTIGSLKADDVSRSITATQTVSRWIEDDKAATLIASAMSQSAEAVEALNNKLSEPIIAHTTVAGDYGINRAQAEYDNLIRNVTPKSRRRK